MLGLGIRVSVAAVYVILRRSLHHLYCAQN